MLSQELDPGGYVRNLASRTVLKSLKLSPTVFWPKGETLAPLSLCASGNNDVLIFKIRASS